MRLPCSSRSRLNLLLPPTTTTTATSARLTDVLSCTYAHTRPHLALTHMMFLALMLFVLYVTHTVRIYYMYV